MDYVEAVKERLRFDEVDEQTPEKISGHEEAEGPALPVRARIEAIECEGEQEKEDELLELCGMARDAVAKIYSPRECGGRAAGIIGQAREEAANAADSDAEAKRDGEEIAGARADVREALGERRASRRGDRRRSFFRRR